MVAIFVPTPRYLLKKNGPVSNEGRLKVQLGHLGFAPKVTPENFQAAFGAAEGWATLEVS